MKKEKKDNQWREVDTESGLFAIVLRANSYNISTMFYKNEEDMLWAMKNSWFDPREATCMKVLPWKFNLENK